MEFGLDQAFNMPICTEPSLRDAISEYLGICLEAHSIDFQPPEILVKLTNMTFALPKVRPALPFILLRALYAFDHVFRILNRSLPGNFSSGVLYRSEGRPASRKGAIVRREIKGSMVPYFLRGNCA